MCNKYQFDKTARSERYFVESLLTHLLMTNNFILLKELFQSVFSPQEFEGVLDSEDIEIVTELDPLRDGSIVNDDVLEIFKKHGRMAVPDLFLRLSNLCLVIEAKFFTHPNSKTINKQITKQIEAINKVKPYTSYADCKFKFASLTTHDAKLDNHIQQIRWSDILEMADKILPRPSDINYVIQQIQEALERTSCNGNIKRMNFTELLRHLDTDSNKNNTFIGYVGGAQALKRAGKDYLIHRMYKVASTPGKIPRNWIHGNIVWNRLSNLP